MMTCILLPGSAGDCNETGNEMNHKQKILIVDDKPENLYTLQQVLGPLKAEIIRAESGNEALIATLNHEFAVAILDVQMPEMNGYELAEWIRGQEKTQNMPIIFLSAVYHGEDHEFRGYTAGAVDYITKPYSPTILIGKVSVFIELERQKQESRYMARQLQASNDELELRVRQRTKALEKTNQALRISERKLRYLSDRLLSAQEEERRRIAAELHDSIGSSLSAIKFFMEGLQAQGDIGQKAAESMENLINLTTQTIGDVRNIMNDLRPPFLRDYGLITALEGFINRFRTIYGSIITNIEIFGAEEDIPEQLRTVIFRVIQETFHNIAKHSRASETNLFMQVKTDRLELRIADNGVGFDIQNLAADQKDKGFGLSTMRERVELSGGDFSLESTMDQGTEIRAVWYLDTSNQVQGVLEQ